MVGADEWKGRHAVNMTCEQLKIAMTFLGWTKRELGRRSTGRRPEGRPHQSITQYLDGTCKIPLDVEQAIIEGLKEEVKPRELPAELKPLLSRR